MTAAQVAVAGQIEINFPKRVIRCNISQIIAHYAVAGS
jgi:hypothetical protein